MLPPLTKRQKELLDFIRSCTKKNGYAPSLEEIRQSFKLKAISTVHEHLENLKAKGYIKKEMNQARGIILQQTGEERFVELEVTKDLKNQTLSPAGDPGYLVSFCKPKDIKTENLYAVCIKDDVWSKSFHICESDILIVLKKNEYKKGEIVITQRNNKCDITKFVSSNPTYKYLGRIIGVVREYIKD